MTAKQYRQEAKANFSHQPERPGCDAEFSFQRGVIGEASSHIQKGKKVVLAASCGSGKTIMAIEIGDRHQIDAGGLVLVLTHGQKILRKQFQATAHGKTGGAIEAERFKHLVNALQTASSDQNVRMIVTLPHTAHKIPKELLQKISLLIVDEAHDFYFASMVQRLIRKLQPDTPHLLLTGTPSPFVAINSKHRGNTDPPFVIVAVAPEDIFKTGAIQPPRVELFSCHHRITRQDYKGDDLSPSGMKKLEGSSGRAATNAVISYLHEEVIKPSQLFSSKKMTNGQLMIVAVSIAQGKDIVNSLKKHGIEAKLSTSRNDKGSRLLTDFQKGYLKALVVVGRGKVGFNAPNLMVLIDLSLSRNISLIFQTMARLYRRPDEAYLRPKEKLYLKVMPRELMVDGFATLNACIALNLRDYFTSILDPSKLAINTREEILDLQKSAGITFGSDRAASQVSRNHVHTKLPAIRELLKRSRETQGLRPSISREAYCSLADLKREMASAPRVACLKKECAEKALLFKTRGKFQLGAPDEYQAAYRNEWLDEICAHMPAPIPRLTKARVIETAKPFFQISPWAKACVKAYKAARDKGWFDEATAHMTRSQRPPRTKEECQKAARKYRKAGPTAWQKSKDREDRGAYRTAMSKGWLNEIAVGMGWRPETKRKGHSIKTAKAKRKMSAKRSETRSRPKSRKIRLDR